MNFIVDTIFCCITLNSFKSIMSLDALVKEKLYLQNAVLQVGTVYFGSDVYIITPEGITGCFPVCLSSTFCVTVCICTSSLA